jgi:hypothetical protein
MNIFINDISVFCNNFNKPLTVLTSPLAKIKNLFLELIFLTEITMMVLMELVIGENLPLFLYFHSFFKLRVQQLFQPTHIDCNSIAVENKKINL